MEEILDLGKTLVLKKFEEENFWKHLKFENKKKEEEERRRRKKKKKEEEEERRRRRRKARIWITPRLERKSIWAEPGDQQ